MKAEISGRVLGIGAAPTGRLRRPKPDVMMTTGHAFMEVEVHLPNGCAAVLLVVAPVDLVCASLDRFVKITVEVMT